MKARTILFISLIPCFVLAILLLSSGDGAFKRAVTISGIYSICRPDGYDAVCFLDSDGKDGGMFCLPLSQVGGSCKSLLKN